MLARVLTRVWENGQHARSQEEHQLTSIVLQLIGQRIDSLSTQGESDLREITSSDLLDLACMAAFGGPFETFRVKNQKRKEFLKEELFRATPDYDPQLDKTRAIRRPEPGTGNMYEMPKAKGSKKQEPVPAVSGDTAEAG